MRFVNCKQLSDEINGYSEDLIIDVVELFKIRYLSLSYLYPSLKEAEKYIKCCFTERELNNDNLVVIYSESKHNTSYYKCVLFFVSYDELKRLFIKLKKMRAFL